MLIDFSLPLLISGFLIGALGFAFFLYGKRQGEPGALITGIALSALPIFTHSLVVLWSLCALCLAGKWAAARYL